MYKAVIIMYFAAFVIHSVLKNVFTAIKFYCSEYQYNVNKYKL
jgi:hypothetical protein